MKKTLLALIIGAAAAQPAPLALAQAARPDGPATPTTADEPPPPPPPEEDGGFQGPHFGHMFKKLGLSDEQKQKVDAIRDKSQAKLKDLGKQLFKERDELGKLITAHSSVEAARLQHKKVQALADQLADQRFDMMYEITGVLTPEQRAQLQDLQKEMMKKWGHRGHHHDK